MLKEYFGDPPLRHVITGPASCMPYRLYQQERDWTCSIACLRTMLSGAVDANAVKDEDSIVRLNHLVPGPWYSDSMKTWAGIRQESAEFRFGCDDPDLLSLDESDIWAWLRDGWHVAINWMMSFDHWCVVLAIDGRPGDAGRAFFFDPYYGDIRDVHVPDLEVMWRSGDGARVHDYVLVRRKA